MINIRFSAKTQVFAVDDLSDAVLEICKEEQAGRVGLLVDDFLERNSAVVAMIDAIRRFGAVVVAKPIRAIEPTTDLVDQVTAELRAERLNLVIGIGGGSVLDLAKAVSVMVLHEGSVTEYHGTGRPTTRSVKKIMIPTTAGTGCEVTPAAVLVNTKTSFKRGLSGPWVCPDYAVLDARLTLSMPEPVVVATGMDALAHATESYVARSANEITRMYARQAFILVANNLPRVLADPGNLDHRRRVLLGSCLAGFSILNSATGACHSLAYPMGIYHHIPHGVGVALGLPKVVEINVGKGCDLYADLFALIEGVSPSRDRAADARAFSRWLTTYPPLARLDPKLTRFGVGTAQVDFLADRGLDLAAAISANPVEFTKTDAVRVLRQLV